MPRGNRRRAMAENHARDEDVMKPASEVAAPRGRVDVLAE